MTKNNYDPFFNQNNIRYTNQKKVCDLIRTNNYSCSELSRILGLSNTALANIMKDFIQKDIVEVAEVPRTKSMGKKPTVYRLNPKYGIVVAVDMTDIDILITGSKMNNQIIFKEIIYDKPYIDINTLNEIIRIIKESIAEHCNDTPLRAISIGTPGKIDKNTGYYIYAPKIIDCTNINLKKLFYKEFSTDIIVHNDVKFALMGEMLFGSAMNLQNIIFLHIDQSYGGAFAINGEVFLGENGFAGEFGCMREYDKAYDYRYNSFSISIGGIIQEIRNRLANYKYEHELKEDQNFNIEEISDLFIRGDKLINQVLEISAEKTAITILNVVSLLDINDVIIDGKISQLGSKYLDLIRKATKEYSDRMRIININYSALMGKATILGGIATAISESTLKLLREV